MLDESFQPTCHVPIKKMHAFVEACAREHPASVALKYLGRKITYQQLNDAIDDCARGLMALGVQTDDVVSICMPNTPETVVLFYAVNRIGGICNMIHPMAPVRQVLDIVTETNSPYLCFPELFLPRFAEGIERAPGPLRRIVVAPMARSAPALKRFALWAAHGRKAMRRLPASDRWITWDDLVKKGRRIDASPHVESDPLHTSVYLHSGGTTASPKTIMLSDDNFNNVAYPIATAIGIPEGATASRHHAMITVLPLFHGFGLCIGMHAMMVHGFTCILVPKFSADDLADIIKKERPTLMAGVPTLYEAMLNSDRFRDVDLSCFRALFCGGDSLTPELKQRFDRFLEAHHSAFKLREGYGLTETVTVCSLTHDRSSDRSGIGTPLANMQMKIVDPDTKAILPDGEIGEICVTGPTVMQGYLNAPEATAFALVEHDDGQVWVETGDLGYRDPDGFYHFTSRIKRMIKVSGVPVYPSQIEQAVAEFPEVLQVAAIGIPHPYKMNVVKLFLRVRPDTDTAALEQKIEAKIKTNMLRYALPKAYEYIDVFPTTLIGKIDYKALEAREHDA